MAKRRKRKAIIRTSLPNASWRLLNSGIDKLANAEKAIYLADRLKQIGEHKLANTMIKYATKLINTL